MKVRHILLCSENTLFKNKYEFVNEEPKEKIKTLSKYQEYIKQNFKLVKDKNPNLKAPEILKKLALEWKSKKSM